MTAEEEGREKALRLYKILACLLGLLGVGLLICGILAVTNTDSDSFGMPYFLGGFIVGILTLISAALCTCIFLKAPGADSDVKKRELACAIQGQYILSMFTIMGCFIGCVSAGVGGLSSSGFDDDDEDEDGPKKTLAVIILVGCIGAIFLTIFSMCIVCTYSSYFGVVIQRGRRGRMVFINNTGQTAGMPTTIHTTTFQTTPQTNSNQVSQLEAQNRLLQQQLELQRQLFQQQQQQQQQTQYSGGFYPPPPPPSYGLNDSAPSAPPPNYFDVK
ncbi:uncharacterized protein LOC123523966 isoform X1 [Mercenaria mercenaria]|uniref:uncharacterized protein LOC123523966 isoform X1 n=1 Tax=Mercenaria mercenaria TaxID=6596 RepID=UPI001E1E0CAB|nr:uncharacterized protein LOC123523966 isoform X1 [Mercenaria mercenaria]